MNISHKHKTIWWAPERCGTTTTSKIFNNFEFMYYLDSEERTLSIDNQGRPYQSHNINISPKYKDYKIICSIRNPYDRMLGIYLNFTSIGRTSVYTKTNNEFFKDKFSYFVEEVFTYKKINSKLKEPIGNKGILINYIEKYKFNTQLPHQYIRMENMIEDLEKIDFISQSEMFKTGQLRNYIENSPHHNIRPYQFNTMYDLKTAKLVYEHNKKHFILFGYDPFSFTSEKLSNEEKMNFLHGIL
jgi:hypothetical protein